MEFQGHQDRKESKAAKVIPGFRVYQVLQEKMAFM
jgi:hypothetical protein